MNREGVAAGRVAVANPLAGLQLAVPPASAVRAGAGRLEWQAGGWKQGEPADGALLAFLRLRNETHDGEFKRFAQHYGVLGLAEDGLPHTSTGNMPPHIGEGAGTWFQEQTSAWRVYARHARALLVLDNALRGEARIDPERILTNAGLWPEPEPPAEPWHDVFSSKRMGLLVDNLKNEPPPNAHRPRSRDGQRLWLGNFLSSEWLSHAAIAPRVVWEGSDRPYVALTLGNPYLARGFQILSTTEFQPLFSVLALQLADAMCGDPQLEECPLCRHMFVPSHPRQVYCAGCKTNAKTQRQSRWRARKGNAATPFFTPKPADGQSTGETVQHE